MTQNLEFYNFLIAGGSSQNVAKTFVNEMMNKASNEEPNSLNEVSCIFLKQLFQAVGLKCSLTVENLIDSKYDGWRQDNLHYIFAYDATKLNLVNEFLTELRHYIDELEQKFQNSEILDRSLSFSPVINHSFLVFNWLKVSTILCTNESYNSITDKYFREPFALLSLFILKSLAPLQHKYREVYPTIKLYSSLLSWVMSFGLQYKRIHKDILKGMLELIKSYHELFIFHDSHQWIFFQRIVTCDVNNTSVIQFLDFLNSLMDKWSSPAMVGTTTAFYLRELTSFLMNKKLINAYYNVITTSKSKKVLITMLNFLNVLQSKLISNEGFTKQFLNGVLVLVLEYHDDVVRKKAVEFYSNIVRTQPEFNILLHILGVYACIMANEKKYFFNWKYFHAYIDELSNVFPMMNLLISYMNIVTNTKVKDLIRKIASKALIYKFNQNQHKVDTSRIHDIDISNFIEALLNLSLTDSDVLIPIVTDVYTYLDCQYFAQKVKQGNEILTNLENFGLNLIVNDYLNLIDLEAMIFNLVKFTNITNNGIKIKAFCDDLNVEFKIQEKYLKNAEATSKVPTKALLSNYYSTLSCLSAVLQNEITFEVDLVYILSCLYQRFYPECMYKKLIGKTKINLYQVAYPLMSKIIIILNRDKYEIREYASNLISIMSKLLTEANPKDRILCGELFKSLVLLHIELAPNGLNLTPTNYNILLISLKLQLSEIYNSIQRCYVYGMFESFKHLIKNSAIILPNSTIWKLLLHYNLNIHNFNKDLGDIIELFLCKRTRNYSRALPVIIYKLNMITPHISNTRIKRVINGHLELINKVLSPFSAWCLKQHCFLSTLEIMIKAAQLTTENTTKNRMLPLRNLLLLVKGMRLKRRDFHTINAIVRDINVPTLSVVEKNTLYAFCGELRQYKNLCLREKEIEKSEAPISGGKFHTVPVPSKAKIPWNLEGASNKSVFIENNEIKFNEEEESTGNECSEEPGSFVIDQSEEEVIPDSDERDEEELNEQEEGPESDATVEEVDEIVIDEC